MCRLFPSIPIFEGLFLIKKCKKKCMCGGGWNCILTCEEYVYYCGGGDEGLGARGSCKTYYFNVN